MFFVQTLMNTHLSTTNNNTKTVLDFHLPFSLLISVFFLHHHFRPTHSSCQLLLPSHGDQNCQCQSDRVLITCNRVFPKKRHTRSFYKHLSTDVPTGTYHQASKTLFDFSAYLFPACFGLIFTHIVFLDSKLRITAKRRQPRLPSTNAVARPRLPPRLPP